MTRYDLLFSLVISTLGASILPAQQVYPAARPLVTEKGLQPRVGTHPGVNAERLKRIDDLLNDYVADGKIAGAVTLVVRDGQVVQYAAYGHDGASRQQPMRRDGIFRIASQTKAITSVGIMMLVEAGQLRLSDPVATYIPSFDSLAVIDQYHAADTTYTTLPAKRAITIRDLLTHTSGLGYPAIGSPMMRAIYAKHGIPTGMGEMQAEISSTMDRLGQLPLEHQPGERWTYGLNTDVLGHIIERITGQPLEDFFRERIFQPLGMKDTWFNLPADRHDRLTTLFTARPEGQLVPASDQRGSWADFPNQSKRYFSGGSGLASTAYDYAIFLQMLLNKGSYNDRRLLAPRSVELMTSNQIGRLWGDGQFGLGFRIVSPTQTDDYAYPGTFSWGGALGTAYWVDPQAGIVALLLTQQLPTGPHWAALQDQFKTAVYQSLE